MIITLDNMEAGLDWWQNSNWPKDFHNDDYYAIYQTRSSGVTREWWEATVDRLGQWRAYRGGHPPRKKCEITNRGMECLDDLAKEYESLTRKAHGEPSISSLCWEDVGGIYQIAYRVKERPVFAGKMCHFLFPMAFIVMDNLGTQVFEYEFYWRGMKDEWGRFKDKGKAIGLLKEQIAKSSKRVHPCYPAETRIMELAHIGYKHPRRKGSS
jgi:hypothetical protein